jgi:signal peptidase I
MTAAERRICARVRGARQQRPWSIMPFNLLRTTFWLLLLGGMLAGFLRLTCLRWWQVPEDDALLTTSLEPSLSPGDWVLLWRLTAPGFGDLVMCPDPSEPGQIVIGRIAAEGGDELSIDEMGALKVNTLRATSETRCKRSTFEVPHPRTGDPVELQCDIEVLGGVHHKRGLNPSAGVKPAPVNTKVRQGELYLVSDNRYYPFDSRDYGSVPLETCRERVFFRLVSRLGFGDVDARLSLIH